MILVFFYVTDLRTNLGHNLDLLGLVSGVSNIQHDSQTHKLVSKHDIFFQIKSD